MHLTNPLHRHLPLLLLLLPLLPLATGNCFTAGESWDSADRGLAYTYAQRACRERLTGVYGNPGGVVVKDACYDHDDNGRRSLSFRFRVRRAVLGEERSLGYDECYDGLQKEIRGCDRGGESEYTNWVYMSDVDVGNCPP
ncbi:hypothetical protein F4779DRAFT_615886 [Xylariaceae sp. FL0662B]|nr:hypothetical protein F4779DRAFT_615886 [Xylariaceae sp. FL0662B]